jgi:hypothetical protein
MTIYIVGTNHELQHDAPPRRVAVDLAQEARRRLQDYLRTLIGRLKPQVIAEEFSEDVLGLKNASSTVVPIAQEFGLTHRFCDPGRSERMALGLPPFGTEECDPPDRHRFDEIRESYWLTQLSDVIRKEILFICGAEHVHSFCALLSSKRTPAVVENEYFGRELYSAASDDLSHNKSG